MSIYRYIRFSNVEVVSSVIIQIIHSETNTVSGQNETGFSCDGSWKTFRVMFKEPIEIMQNQFYTASATLIVSQVLHSKIIDTFLFRDLIVIMVQKD